MVAACSLSAGLEVAAAGSIPNSRRASQQSLASIVEDESSGDKPSSKAELLKRPEGLQTFVKRMKDEHDLE